MSIDSNVSDLNFHKVEVASGKPLPTLVSAKISQRHIFSPGAAKVDGLQTFV